MQFVAAFTDGVIAPRYGKARFSRGGFHHLHRFGHDFQADVVAQQDSNFQHFNTPFTFAGLLVRATCSGLIPTDTLIGGRYTC